MPRREQLPPSAHQRAVEYLREHPMTFDEVYWLAADIALADRPNKPPKHAPPGRAALPEAELSTEQAARLNDARRALGFRP